MLLLIGIAVPLYVVIAVAIEKWRKKIAWHTHVIIAAFTLSVASNVANPPYADDYLYGAVVGTVAGLVWVVIYLAIIGCVMLFRRGGNTDANKKDDVQ